MAFLLGLELWQTQGDDSLSMGSGQAQNNVFLFFLFPCCQILKT